MVLDEGRFHLYLNGVLCRDFSDDEVPYHTYGRSGLVAVISPQDHFPQEYVDIRYTVEP